MSSESGGTVAAAGGVHPLSLDVAGEGGDVARGPRGRGAQTGGTAGEARYVGIGNRDMNRRSGGLLTPCRGMAPEHGRTVSGASAGGETRSRDHGGRMAAPPDTVVAPDGAATSPRIREADEPAEFFEVTQPALGAAAKFVEGNAEGAGQSARSARV